MFKKLEGKQVAVALDEKTAQEVENLKARGIEPRLAIFRVGENESDIAYERGAQKRCENLGIHVCKCTFSTEISEQELIGAIKEMNEDATIHGCLILRPLPGHIDDNALRQALLPQKDVDGITDGSLAAVFSGFEQGFAPCTAEACVELLNYYGISVTGKNVVVLGRSLVIGKPVAMMLLRKNATVTICHTKTEDLAKVCRQADILVAAAGKQGLVTKDFLHEKQVVLDVGIHVGADGKICGDVDFPIAETMVSAATPVPGGVGAVTTAVLASHVVKAAVRIDSLSRR
ncbi:MAG: bifunctional 5,10-methylenetetrahydrofolate dehydrogenase/5,10-methenyltetrahydrofolate cyclohydrolase [Clostridia bacterium]|nr:bifunctional 5,10-methylenetetrahydrofolate dehydrogenase/5,10-methenyltetrahydrofolate cyclohydrolase [Clostridia bacterium]